MNGMSLCFVGKNDYLIALDSYPHNLQGVMVAQKKMGNQEELLTTLKLLLSPQFHTCSLTFVSFAIPLQRTCTYVIFSVSFQLTIQQKGHKITF